MANTITIVLGDEELDLFLQGQYDSVVRLGSGKYNEKGEEIIVEKPNISKTEAAANLLLNHIYDKVKANAIRNKQKQLHTEINSAGEKYVKPEPRKIELSQEEKDTIVVPETSKTE